MNSHGGVEVALVTEANRGLGIAVARKLARRGFVVYLGSRDLARAREAAAELRRGDLVVTPVELDVTDVDSVGRVAARIMQEHGRLDVLVNNAGLDAAAPAADTGKAYETNVFGLVCVTSAMLPLLRRSAAPRIVNVAGTRTGARGESDASSKAAVTMLTVQYADALKRRPEYAHIKVNAVTAGYAAPDVDKPAESVHVVFELATVGEDGPSGAMFKR